MHLPESSWLGAFTLRVSNISLLVLLHFEKLNTARFYKISGIKIILSPFFVVFPLLL